MEILTLGNPILRQKSEPVTEVTPELEKTFEEMFDLMIETNGVGLAAPQVGILQRFFVCMADDDVKRVFVNPQIIETSSELGEYEEGCLSIPKLYEKIVRPVEVLDYGCNHKHIHSVIYPGDLHKCCINGICSLYVRCYIIGKDNKLRVGQILQVDHLAVLAQGIAHLLFLFLVPLLLLGTTN